MFIIWSQNKWSKLEIRRDTELTHIFWIQTHLQKQQNADFLYSMIEENFEKAFKIL